MADEINGEDCCGNFVGGHRIKDCALIKLRKDVDECGKKHSETIQKMNTTILKLKEEKDKALKKWRSELTEGRKRCEGMVELAVADAEATILRDEANEAARMGYDIAADGMRLRAKKILKDAGIKT